jgi:hypothetical protein
MGDKFDYQRFKNEIPENDNCIIDSCKLSINLLDDYEVAEFNYEITFQVVGDGKEVLYSDLIPTRKAKEITNVSAKDGVGTLQCNPKKEGSKTNLIIKFRQDIVKGSSYTINYSYTNTIITTAVVDFFKSAINYSDWLSFDVYCKYVNVIICLPKKTKIISTYPTTDSKNGHLTFEHNHLQPKDKIEIAMTYEKSGVSKNFWLWLISTIASGLIGYVISCFQL